MTKPFIFILCIGIFFASLFSCEQNETQLENALNKGASNRIQLEKVLSHYSIHIQDSLHLKAARFLIKNMPGHLTYSNPFIENYINTMDSVYPTMSNIVKRVVYNIPLRELMLELEKLGRVEDVKIIKSEFLIQHIDNAIEMWTCCPWLRSFTFEDFCEYVLPYRMAKEPLLESDSTLYWWKQLVEVLDYYQYEPKMMVELKSLQGNVLNIDDGVYMENIQTPSLSVSTYRFDCLDVCYYTLGKLRAVGIPAAIDFVPGWPYRNNNHYWFVMIDPAYINRNHSDRLFTVAPKVYRMTYSHQPVPESNGKDSIPELFKEPFYKDVSKEYLNVSNLEVEWNQRSSYVPQYAYLSIFNNLEWTPIAWTILQKDKAMFKDVGRGIVYLPVYYRGKNLKNIGYPRLLDMQGKVTEFMPDEKKRISIRMTRKFPLNDSKVFWAESLKGAYIVASNDADFRKVDTLYTIIRPNKDLNYQIISLKTEKPYRYWRIGKRTGKLNVAEWQFFDEMHKKLTGKVNPCREEDKDAERVVDGDVLTFSEFRSWLGVDLGRPEQVTEMKLLSRTDDNGIVPGELYELVYFGKDGWKTIAVQKAENDYIEFDSVPSGALYWLRNLTKGTEERIFTYEKERIKYW